MAKKQVEERVYSPYTSMFLLLTTKGSQDRNSNMAGSWRQRGAAYWLASSSLLSLLSYRTQDYQPRHGITDHRLKPTSIDH